MWDYGIQFLNYINFSQFLPPSKKKTIYIIFDFFSNKQDAALDSYMGADVCKARLDSQLDSYFSGQSTGNDSMVTDDSSMNVESNQEPVLISL